MDAHPATEPLVGPPSVLELQGGGILRCTTHPSDLPWQASALGASVQCRLAASPPPGPLEGWEALAIAPHPQVSLSILSILMLLALLLYSSQAVFCSEMALAGGQQSIMTSVYTASASRKANPALVGFITPARHLASNISLVHLALRSIGFTVLHIIAILLMSTCQTVVAVCVCCTYEHN